MLRVSFRWLPNASFPCLRGGKPALVGLAAAVIVLAGCGGGGHKASAFDVQTVSGSAYRFSARARRGAPGWGRAGWGSGLPRGGGRAPRPSLSRAVERRGEHAVERVGEDEVDRLARLLREFLQVGLVLARQHDAADPGPLRGE